MDEVSENYLEGGVGVFHGYLNRSAEENGRVLLRLSGRDGLFYRTGDLGKINAQGEIVLTGRVDPGDIESVIMRISSDIRSCLVVRVNHRGEEHLVGYIQSKVQWDLNILHDECLKKLSLYMIPSLFVLIDRWSGNENGKLNTTALPPPHFSLLLIRPSTTKNFDLVSSSSSGIDPVDKDQFLQLRREFSSSDPMEFFLSTRISPIEQIITNHSVFRTRLVFDVERGILFQSIGETSPDFPFRLSVVHDEEERASSLREEFWTPFDTEHDGVFRCHFICSHRDDGISDTLTIGDLLVFYFHHGSFDGRAMDISLDELKLAYAGEQLQTPTLQYIDYSSLERSLPVTEARIYWRELLRDHAWDRQLNLGRTKPVSSARRSGRGLQLVVAIPSDIARSMILCAYQLDVTLFQLGLTCFYLFLTQISSDNRDACIGVIHLNRYPPELVSMIGMFVNILPGRITNASLPNLSFAELIRHVQQTFLASVQHAHLLYDEVINLHRASTPCLRFPFLQTIFSVDTSTIDYTNTDDIRLGDSCHLSTCKIDLSDFEIGFNFDFDFSLAHDVQTETIDCLWAYMLDVFEHETIRQHSWHFIHLLTQLFGSSRAEPLHRPLGEIIQIGEEKRDQLQSILQMDIHRIRAVFSRVLGCTVAEVDVHRSFFEQGGTSLKALQAVAFLNQQLSSHIVANLYFDSLSVSQLARAIYNK